MRHIFAQITKSMYVKYIPQYKFIVHIKTVPTLIIISLLTINLVKILSFTVIFCVCLFEYY